MLAEVRLGIRFVGLGRLLKNARAFKQARAAIRGYITTICYWTLMRVGWLDEIEQKGHVTTEAFCAANHFDHEMLANVIRYLRRQRHLKERNGTIRFTRQGRKYLQAVTTTFDIFSAGAAISTGSTRAWPPVFERPAPPLPFASSTN